jgi:membrane-associated phospholipid phosphatase
VTPEGPPGTPSRSGRTPGLGAERAVGIGLLAAVALAGAYFHVRPQSTPLDHLGVTLRPADVHSQVFLALTRLGSAPALVGGSLAGAAVALARALRRREDARRAVACLLAPFVAVALGELVAKHLVGREYQQELTFPSGTVTVVAAVGTAWVLAVPRRARWALASLASLATVVTVDTVVALQWHLPTDALAGAALGVGTVLVVDGVLRGAWTRVLFAVLVGRPAHPTPSRQK